MDQLNIVRSLKQTDYILISTSYPSTGPIEPLKTVSMAEFIELGRGTRFGLPIARYFQVSTPLRRFRWESIPMVI